MRDATNDVDPSPTALGTGRLEALSDGIIAIAATLLVLELHVPEPGEDVWAALGHELPSLAAFVVSFLTILILWVNHHTLFRSVRHADRAVLFVNGLLLGISFASFPTAVLGRALQGGADARPAAVLYGLTFAATAACYTALWVYLRARPAMLVPAAREHAGASLRRSLVGPALYGASVLVALVDATAALVVAALVAGYFALGPRHLRAAGR